MSRLVEVNQATLIGIMLYDGATNQFPRARVYNAAGTEQSGSPFALTHVANGYYSNNSWTPTVEGIYFVAIRTFSDAGFTTLNPKYEQWGETVEVRSVDQDLATLLTRIGTPAGASLSADVAAIQADTNDIQAKIGTPVTTLAGDIAAVQSDTNDIQAKIGTPAGASVSADIAAVKAETASIQSDTNDIQAKIGTPVSTLAGDIAGVQADTDDIQTKIGTPAGASVSADIAAVKAETASIQSDTNDIQSKIGTPVSTLAGDVAGVQSDTDDIQAKIGTPVTTLAGDIAAVQTKLGTPAGASVSADIAAVKSDTSTLTSRLTATRAGYLDNLPNLDTTVSSRASQASVDAIQNNTRFAMVVQSPLILPTSGSQDYKFFGRLYDDAGSPEDPDSNTVNIRIETPGGTVVVATTAMTRTAVGAYEYTYTVNAGDPERPLVVFMEYSENSVAFQQVRTTEVQEFETKLDTLLSRLTATRAGYLDNLPNLDATVSSRQSASTALTQYNSLQADTDDIQSKIGTPVSTLAGDIASVQADTTTLLGRLTATRAGYLDNLPNLDATVSSRQSAATALTQYNNLQADTDDIQSKIGTPVGTLASDIAGVQATATSINNKLGTPVVTVSDDIAAVKADTSAILTDTGVTGVVLSAAAEAQLVDAVWDELQASHTVAGSFGKRLDVDVSAVKTDTQTLIDADVEIDTVVPSAMTIPPIGTKSGKVFFRLFDGKGDQLDPDSNTAYVRITEEDGTPIVALTPMTRTGIGQYEYTHTITPSTAAGIHIVYVSYDYNGLPREYADEISIISADVDSIGALLDLVYDDTQAIKAQTDQLTFTGSNVNANAQVVSDKTDYALSAVSQAAVVDDVWDEQLSGHAIPGSTGEALSSTTAATPAGIADAVWDALVAPHNIPNTFGNYIQVIRQSSLSTLAELNSPSYGLSQIYNAIGNSESAVIAQVNQNETKIDAIIPYVNSQTVLLKAEIDQNQILIEALATQLTSVESNLISEVNVVETKVDAVSADISTIQNNTTVRFVVPERLVKPTSGTKTYQFHLRLYDETGYAEAPDSTPTIRIRRLDTGVDIVAGAAMTPDGVKVGAFYYDFSITSGTDEYQALVEVTVIENGATRYVPAVTEITEFESDLNAIQSQLTDVENTVVNTNLAVNSGVYGLAALKTGQGQIITEIDANETLLVGVKARTDLIPNDPATLASVAAVNATVLTRPDINTIQARLDLTRDYIVGPDNRNNTAIYDKIDFTPIMKTNDPRLNFLDAAVSSRSTLDAVSVWTYGTRELTGFSLPPASVKAVWDYLASQATVSGSLGKLMVDNLDAKVSTRATASQVSSALAGVAQESTVSSLAGLITSGDNQTQIDVAAVKADTAAIRAKTQNLPSDPVSTSVVTGGFSTQASALATLDLKTTGIKSKTDNLPPDPAKETSVLARPTNPVLATDLRLARLDVNVSTRGTLNAGDIAGLATAAGLTATQTALASEINANETKIDTVQATVNLVKAKTDLIPSQPVSKAQLDASTDEILTAIDDISGGGSGITAADVWTYPSRTITQDPASFGPDISDLATKEDVEEITINTAFCRMSTTLNSSDGTQEVIVWLEKNGAPFSAATNARIKVKSTEGSTLWEANLASPNADGVFAFSMPFVPPAADRSYYIEMLINDGAADISGRSAFITVG